MAHATKPIPPGDAPVKRWMTLSQSTLIAILVLASSVTAQESAPKEGGAKPKDTSGEEPVVTRHEIKLGEKALSYKATAGLMPIRNEKDEVEARIFYIAYTLEHQGELRDRPLMFSFNGGPGSASVWLHLGALGPKRVQVPSEPEFATPPYRLVDNTATWLDQTDLVFIDPVGTGYSRAAKPDLNKKFHGLRGDIDSVGEFIRMYLTRNERWASPLYLVGESYGTTRAAGLSDHLVERGIALNGIVLVSAVLDFQTLSPRQGNDLPYELYLPTFAATAWYHKKLATDLQSDLGKLLDEVEAWASKEYREALGRGDELKGEERRAVVARLARYTGLSERFLENSNLRVGQDQFCKELLRDDKRTVGRLDSRYKGIDALPAGSSTEFDPSMAAIRPPYTATINQYMRSELGYKSDVPYYILGEGVGEWDWGGRGMGYPQTGAALRDALAKNPHMRVLVASGYYDLATPYAASEYTLSHMRLDPALRKNIHVEEYEAGHMMYVHEPSLKKLKVDLAGFLRDSGAR
jgi:carboxypeptidase C (cathepsin A)